MTRPSGWVSVERLLPKPEYVRDIDSEYHSDDLRGQILRGLAQLEAEPDEPSDLTAPLDVIG